MMRYNRTLITTFLFLITTIFLLSTDIRVQAAATEDGWEYEEMSDGNIKILRYGGSAVNVVIPTKINEKSVTMIGFHTFYQNHTMISLVIPYGVTGMEYGAIEDCDNLERVAMPASVLDVGGSLWCDCEKVKFLYVEAGSFAENCALVGECHYFYQGNMNCSHVFDEKISKKADCAATGEKMFICRNCGGYYIELYWDDTHTVVTEPKIAPNCTEAGRTKRSYCSVCKIEFENPEYIEALGHKYTTIIKKATPKKNGSVSVQCKRCGKKDENASYIIYKPDLMFSLSSKADMLYTGKAIKPKVYVLYTGKSGSHKISYKNNKNVGTATVTVIFKGKYYTGKWKKTFKINPKETAIKDITVWENTLTVKWKPQKKQVTGYQIQYSTNKNFKGAKDIWVKNYKKSSEKLAKLKENTTYYIRLRSYKEVKVNGKKKKFYSAWNGNLMQKDTEQKMIWTKPYQLTDTLKIVYKEGYTWVNTIVSSYEEACAVARDLGYPLWQFVDEGGDNVWYYGMFRSLVKDNDIGTFEKDFYRASDQYGRFLEMRGYTSKMAGESSRLNTKDGRIYIPDVNGGTWCLTSYEISR